MYKIIWSGHKPEVSCFESIEQVCSFFAAWLMVNSVYYRREFEELSQLIQVTGKDEYWDNRTWTYKVRPITVLDEDGNAVDIRRYRKQIETSPANLHFGPYTPSQPGHGSEGYTLLRKKKRKYIHHLHEAISQAEQAREYGLKPTTSGKRWWWFEDDFNTYMTRTWKDQTKSRKQWGRHKKNPIKRVPKPVEDEDLACLL